MYCVKKIFCGLPIRNVGWTLATVCKLKKNLRKWDTAKFREFLPSKVSGYIIIQYYSAVWNLDHLERSVSYRDIGW